MSRKNQIIVEQEHVSPSLLRLKILMEQVTIIIDYKDNVLKLNLHMSVIHT